MADKTKILFFIIFFMLLNLSVVARADNQINLNAKSYILVHPDSGRILVNKNSDEKRPMASTTKIMTAIIAIENGDLSSKVKVSKKSASVGGSSFNLKVDEEMSLESMLYGLLMCSGNDAAVAIAEHIAGNTENFVKMMNQKAIDIGAINTHFENPHGLDSPYHYTTAEDLVKIAYYAWNIPKFREIVSTVKKTIYEGNYTRSITNTNRLLRQFEAVNGIKTGYTGQAGKCLVASAVKNDFHLISVVLGAHNHFSVSRELLNYGFSNFNLSQIVEAQKSYYNINVENGFKDKLLLIAQNDEFIPVSESDSINLKVVTPDKIKAPIYKNQPVGELQIFINQNLISSTPLVASQDIKELTLVDKFYIIIKRWLNINISSSNSFDEKHRSYFFMLTFQKITSFACKE